MLKNRGFLYPLQEFYQPLHNNIQFMDQVEYLYDLNLDANGRFSCFSR